MTDNEKLARWQGWKVQPRGKVTPPIPDYLNDDAAATRLLDTLVERGYKPTLQYHKEMGWWIEITKEIGAWADNHREAVAAACLELIKETD